MEMIKLVQAWLISNDVDMYYEETDTPATAHTSTINEELGQVNFVFSDKTGTLTENLMVFRKISCGGWAYLHDLDLIEKQSREGAAIQEIAQQVHRSATRISRNSLSQSIRRGMRNLVDQPSPQDEMEETMLLSELNSAPRLKVDNDIPKTTDLMQSIIKNPQASLQRRLQFFLLAIALCHTVIPQVDQENGEINYQAASPDEYALVNAAKEMGYVVIERSVRHVILKKPRSDEPIRFEILNVLEFSSKRKRMSVIIRLPDNRIVLFCKGADSIVLERSHLPEELVSPISPTEIKRAPWHTNTAAASSTVEVYDECDFTDISVEEERWEYARTIHHIQQFATEGLRTLLYAHRFMTQKEYDEWNVEYTKASLSIEDRQEKLFDAAEIIEVGLRITGATAIEDKLQEGVADSIDRIRKAGMRMWMLTGDKRETAINIGYSCSLIHNNSRLIYLEAGPQLENVMLQALQDVQNGQASDAVLIMDGITLGTIENDKEILALFCQLGCLCQSVICCRFSPAQKALVVKATRAAAPRAVTLAIGDGANDCAMIQEAHVGIGITGKEGMQAARASDYSIGQFRFLCKLLLVHGHWSYIRVAKFTLGTFFKCMTFYLTQGIFQLWTGFSGTSLYEGWSLSFYNTLFSSLPVMMIGVFERDFRASTLIANPELYKIGQRSGAFNFIIFVKWIISAWWYAACIVLMPLALNGTLFVFPEHHGEPSPNATKIASLALFDGSFQLYSFGLMLYSITVIIVTLKVAYLECHTQTIISHLVAWAEIGCFVLYNLIYSYAYPASKSYEYAVNGEFVRLLRMPVFWLIVVFTVTIAIGPSVVGKAVSDWVWPTEEVHFQELEKDDRISQLWEAEAKRQMVGVEKKTIVNNNAPVPSHRPNRWQKLQFKRSY
jgi:phospholipid-translocating ATPase